MKRRKLGRGVSIVAAGMSSFGVFPGKVSRDLFLDAYLEMIGCVDRGIDPKDIEAIYLGNYSSDIFEGQGHTAPIVADWIGLTPRAAVRIEDACASSGVAFRQAVLAVASGAYDIVLAGGMEKMTNLPTEKVTDALATAGDMMFEIPAGFTFPSFYAVMATAYASRYNVGLEFLKHVTIKNHNNGSLNPKAQFGQKISDLMEAKKKAAAAKGKPVPEWSDEMAFLADERANPTIAWPLQLFDCSPISDGAAAVLVVSDEIARSLTDTPIHIIGTGQASDGALHARKELTSIASARLAVEEAYTMAGIGPKDVDLAEVHDCFTIAEVIATEDLGFFPVGEGCRAVVEGKTRRDGGKPINTSGGLKSKGHPVGASGAGQVVEIWKQLRGVAGERQVDGGPSIGLTHNVGGTGQTTVVNIFERK
ncbi:MAG: beta-ketoacyl synthase N-terminal-like domain-containing protein [Ignavibacteriales bacterium]|nr:beta-ketoacyl synthase N-terminal-like domain-containing protein [Ignavibacteriales bacterium]